MYNCKQRRHCAVVAVNVMHASHVDTSLQFREWFRAIRHITKNA